MAPVEFENKIKKLFDKRRIKPSADAWNRIGDRLESKPKTNRFPVLRYGIAAALAALLLSVIWLSDSEEPILENTPVVVQPAISDEVLMSPDKEVQHIAIDADLTEVPDEQPESSTLVASDEPDPLAKEARTSRTPAENYADQMIDQKITEVAAHVKLLEDGKESVTDAEVDSLLRHAQRELLADKAFNESNGVDAQELLAGVEDELNKSFRDQVFEKLKNGFVKVRTAVADRNN